MRCSLESTQYRRLLAKSEERTHAHGNGISPSWAEINQLGNKSLEVILIFFLKCQILKIAQVLLRELRKALSFQSNSAMIDLFLMIPLDFNQVYPNLVVNTLVVHEGSLFTHIC